MAKFTVKELLMGRATESELSAELLDNAKELVSRVNALMVDLNYTKTAKLSSGYRQPEANKAANGAKNSPHLICKAMDIIDDDKQTLATLVLSKPDLLRKHGLFVENPEYTRGKWSNWLHIDSVERKDRPSRMFNP